MCCPARLAGASRPEFQAGKAGDKVHLPSFRRASVGPQALSQVLSLITIMTMILVLIIMLLLPMGHLCGGLLARSL